MIKVANNLQQLMVKQASLSELVDTRGERALLGGLLGAVATPLTAKFIKKKMTPKDYALYALMGGAGGAGITATADEAVDQIIRMNEALAAAPHGDPGKFQKEVEDKLKDIN
jgi:hypothetical protein